MKSPPLKTMENKKQQTIPQSKEWSISIECFNNATNDYDLKLEEVIEKIKHDTHYYFGITHNKDTKDTGEIRKAHIHIVIKLKTRRTKGGILKRLANLLNIDKQRISVEMTRSQEATIRYLMHLDNPEKAQYAPIEIITNRQDILNLAIKGENEREDLTAENLIITIEKHGGNRLKIMSEIGLNNYTRYRGTIQDIIQELELIEIQDKAMKQAREQIDKARDLANSAIKYANTQINKRINEKIKEVENKAINEKAIELLNKKRQRT